MRNFVLPAHLADSSIAGVIQPMSLDLGEDTMLAQFAASMEQARLLYRLQELRMPVMIVCAQEDATVCAHDLRAMAQQVPGARPELIGGGSQMVALKALERLRDALLCFLKSIDAVEALPV